MYRQPERVFSGDYGKLMRECTDGINSVDSLKEVSRLIFTLLGSVIAAVILIVLVVFRGLAIFVGTRGN